MVELLVAVAIIAVLAALLVPALGVAQRAADRTGCTGNLRSIGIAAGSYMADHDQYFPGPSSGGQNMCYYNGGPTVTPTDLVGLLAPYLGYAGSQGKTVVAKPWACPAWLRHTQPVLTKTCVSYIRNSRIIFSTGWQVDPCGSASLSPPTNPIRPMQLDAMSGVQARDSYAGAPSYTFTMGSAWFLEDGDMSSRNMPATSWYGVAATPVHRDVRMKLFFDWHVQEVPATPGND